TQPLLVSSESVRSIEADDGANPGISHCQVERHDSSGAVSRRCGSRFIDLRQSAQNGERRFKVTRVQLDLGSRSSQVENLRRWSQLRNGRNDVSVAREKFSQLDVRITSRAKTTGIQHERKSPLHCARISIGRRRRLEELLRDSVAVLRNFVQVLEPRYAIVFFERIIDFAKIGRTVVVDI